MRLPAKLAAKVDEVEDVSDTCGEAYMVHLARGFCLNDIGSHTFGEYSRKDVMGTLQRVEKCNCIKCAT